MSQTPSATDNPRIAALGSCHMDLVAVVDKAPQQGETIFGKRFFTIPGGKGANQAIAAARAGGNVSFIGAVGCDDFGDQLSAALTNANIDISQLRKTEAPTGTAHITVDSHGENSIIVIPGADANLTALTPNDEELIRASDILLCQLESPIEAVIAGAQVAHNAGTTVILTPAPVQPLPSELLHSVDVIVANAHEAAALTGESEPAAALEALLQRVPHVVITLGSVGCRYGTRNSPPIAISGQHVQAVDTTAAGDTFVGALAVALTEKQPWPAALNWANTAAALCVQREGASSSMPHRTDIEAALTTKP